MSTTAQFGAPPPEHWAWRRLRQFWLVVPLVGILAALMLWTWALHGSFPSGLQQLPTYR